MSNLKIRDLSVGDWVKIDIYPTPYKIIDLSSRGYVWLLGRNRVAPIRVIEPIPITPKILEKNGFEKNSECCWRNSAIQCSCLRYGSKYWDMRINGRNRAYRPTRITIDNILHIHELQNALRLAGLDEDIEL